MELNERYKEIVDEYCDNPDDHAKDKIIDRKQPISKAYKGIITNVYLELSPITIFIDLYEMMYPIDDNNIIDKKIKVLKFIIFIV